MDEFCILGLEYLNKNSAFRQVNSLKYFTFSLHPVMKFEMQALLLNEETLSGRLGQVLYSQLFFPNIRRQKNMQRFQVKRKYLIFRNARSNVLGT
jgi:hypothetical protein